MAISSPGIGSGLDVSSIVSQLVALEKKPLEQLQTQASTYSAKLSAFGQIKSQMANLADMASKLKTASNWESMSFSSTQSAAVSGSATASAVATSFTVEVSQLARAQATGSASISPAGSAVGEGKLKIQLGGWSGGVPNTFMPGTATEVEVDVSAANTLSEVAASINAKKAGVTAVVINDSAGERLLMRSSSTGTAAAFRVQATTVAGVAITDGTGVGRLSYDPQNNTGGMGMTESALNATASINGVAVTSYNNTLADTIEGVTLNLSTVTTDTGPVTVSIARDTSAAQKAVTDFVSSYNAISGALSEMTKYNPSSKTAGTLQGDATAVGLQTALRRLVGGAGPAGGAFGRLSDIGLEFQTDGSLKTNSTKLTAALAKPDELKNFFSLDSGSDATNGLALRIKSFADGLLALDGTLTTKAKSIQSSIDRNTKDQERVSDRVAASQARLTAQYSRLDASLGKLTALSTYVNQQVTAWNNSGSD